MHRTAVLCLLATAGFAAQAESFVDHARVRSVQPQYENVAVPRQECSSQWVPESRPYANENNYGGAVIGGVAGAVVGRQIGGGSGRDAATAIGAVVGAMAGDRLANRGQQWQGYPPAEREVRSCRTVTEMHNRITGYRVTYDYRGHQHTTFMREHPGHTVAVRVSVVPLERDYHRPY